MTIPNIARFLTLLILLSPFSALQADLGCSGGRVLENGVCVCPGGKTWHGMRGCVCPGVSCEGRCCRTDEQCQDVGGGRHQCMVPCKGVKCGVECCTKKGQVCDDGRCACPNGPLCGNACCPKSGQVCTSAQQCTFPQDYRVKIVANLENYNQFDCSMMDMNNKGHALDSCIQRRKQGIFSGEELTFPKTDCILPYPRRVWVTCHGGTAGVNSGIHNGSTLHFPADFH